MTFTEWCNENGWSRQVDPASFDLTGHAPLPDVVTGVLVLIRRTEGEWTNELYYALGSIIQATGKWKLWYHYGEDVAENYFTVMAWKALPPRPPLIEDFTP